MRAVTMTELPPDTPARQAPRGAPGPRGRRPGPGLVIWSSIALFATMFAFLTYQLSATAAPAARPVLVKKVVKRRVVTTIVPTPGRSTVTSSGGTVGSSSGYAPVTTSAS